MDGEWAGLTRIKQHFSIGTPLASRWEDVSVWGTVLGIRGQLAGLNSAHQMPTIILLPVTTEMLPHISKYLLGRPQEWEIRVGCGVRLRKPEEQVWPWSLRWWKITGGLWERKKCGGQSGVATGVEEKLRKGRTQTPMREVCQGLWEYLWVTCHLCCCGQSCVHVRNGPAPHTAEKCRVPPRPPPEESGALCSRRAGIDTTMKSSPTCHY